MKTKNDSPMLSTLLYLVAFICFMGAMVTILGVVTSTIPEVYLFYALGFGVASVMYFAMAKAIHMVLDFLVRTAESNEQILALLTDDYQKVPARHLEILNALLALPSAQTRLPPSGASPSPTANATTTVSSVIAPIPAPLLAGRSPVPAAAPGPSPAAGGGTKPSPRAPVANPVAVAALELKALCANCSTKVAFPPDWLGQEAPCPTCNKPLLLIPS